VLKLRQLGFVIHLLEKVCFVVTGKVGVVIPLVQRVWCVVSRTVQYGRSHAMNVLKYGAGKRWRGLFGLIF
jgi:hypothetical protein